MISLFQNQLSVTQIKHLISVKHVLKEKTSWWTRWTNCNLWRFCYSPIMYLSYWSDWSACDVTCGSGNQTRTRQYGPNSKCWTSIRWTYIFLILSFFYTYIINYVLLVSFFFTQIIRSHCVKKKLAFKHISIYSWYREI